MLAAVVLLMHAGHVWLPPAATLAGLLLAYPLWSWRRLEAALAFLDEELARIGARSGIARPASEPIVRVDPIEGRISAVRAAAARLERADGERRQMLDFIAHDLRSPQVSILALLDTPQRSPESIAATFARIDTHARRTLDLADQFVQLADTDHRDATDCHIVDVAMIAHDAADATWELA